jgi:hypothetical protein
MCCKENKINLSFTELKGIQMDCASTLFFFLLFFLLGDELKGALKGLIASTLIFSILLNFFFFFFFYRGTSQILNALSIQLDFHLVKCQNNLILIS